MSSPTHALPPDRSGATLYARKLTKETHVVTIGGEQYELTVEVGRTKRSLSNREWAALGASYEKFINSIDERRGLKAAEEIYVNFNNRYRVEQLSFKQASAQPEQVVPTEAFATPPPSDESSMRRTASAVDRSAGVVALNRRDLEETFEHILGSDPLVGFSPADSERNPRSGDLVALDDATPRAASHVAHEPVVHTPQPRSSSMSRRSFDDGVVPTSLSSSGPMSRPPAPSFSSDSLGDGSRPPLAPLVTTEAVGTSFSTPDDHSMRAVDDREPPSSVATPRSMGSPLLSFAPSPSTLPSTGLSTSASSTSPRASDHLSPRSSAHRVAPSSSPSPSPLTFPRLLSASERALPYVGRRKNRRPLAKPPRAEIHLPHAPLSFSSGAPTLSSPPAPRGGTGPRPLPSRSETAIGSPTSRSTPPARSGTAALDEVESPRNERLRARRKRGASSPQATSGRTGTTFAPYSSETPRLARASAQRDDDGFSDDEE